MKNQVLSRAQMRELKELGIDTNHGSMYWHNYNTDDDPQYELCSSADIGDITTFTLQDILEMLPKIIVFKDDHEANLILCDTSLVYYETSTQTFCLERGGKNMLEAAFNMLKWCKQNNYI